MAGQALVFSAIHAFHLEITKEEYDQWRYRYPEFDTTQRWAKVPSQELSDFIVDALKEQSKVD